MNKKVKKFLTDYSENTGYRDNMAIVKKRLTFAEVKPKHKPIPIWGKIGLAAVTLCGTFALGVCVDRMTQLPSMNGSKISWYLETNFDTYTNEAIFQSRQGSTNMNVYLASADSDLYFVYDFYSDTGMVGYLNFLDEQNVVSIPNDVDRVAIPSESFTVSIQFMQNYEVISSSSYYFDYDYYSTLL